MSFILVRFEKEINITLSWLLKWKNIYKHFICNVEVSLVS